MSHCTSKNALRHAHKHLKGIPTLQEPVSDGPCKGCQLGKAHERAFPASLKRSDCVLGLIYTDLCKFLIQYRSHTKWMITLLMTLQTSPPFIFCNLKQMLSQLFRIWLLGLNLKQAFAYTLYVQTEVENISINL